MFVTATYIRDGTVLLVFMSYTKIKYAILLNNRETLPIDFSWYEKHHSLLYGFYTLKFVQTKKTRYNVITGELLTFHLHTEHS